MLSIVLSWGCLARRSLPRGTAGCRQEGPTGWQEREALRVRRVARSLPRAGPGWSAAVE